MTMRGETEQILIAVKSALDAAKRPPTVVGQMIELGTDEANDPAVFITVLLKDDTPEGEWVSSNLDPIADAVRKAVSARGVDRWPYIRFARRSDASGPDGDDRAWKPVKRVA